MINKTLIKEIILRLWSVGMIVFIAHFMLLLDHFFIAILIAVFDTLFVEMMIDCLEKANRQKNRNKKTLYLSLIRNLTISLPLCFLISQIDFVLLKKQLVVSGFGIEPFRFSILYNAMFYGVSYLFKCVFKKKMI